MQLACLINQTVGDAISDILFVEYALYSLNWTLFNWQQCYVDLPNRLMKLTVHDRTIFETVNADQKLLNPPGLQSKLDDIIRLYPSGRAFVRPSGTEDVVRVYAEAEMQTQADDLASKICDLVYDYAGGVGPRPQLN